MAQGARRRRRIEGAPARLASAPQGAKQSVGRGVREGEGLRGQCRVRCSPGRSRAVVGFVAAAAEAELHGDGDSVRNRRGERGEKERGAHRGGSR